MLTVSDISLRFSDRKLFDNVNINFTAGNTYGLIGANGAGKSTFLKILAGDIEPTTGHVALGPNERLSVLRQNHFDYEEERAIDVVIMGNEQLYQVMKKKDAIYMKPDFSEEDGVKAAELEGTFAELGGWEAESEASQLLQNLNIPEDLHYQNMSELANGDKVKVLLAKALFGKPDVLLLDEPTNGLDIQSISWLEEFLIDFENTVIVVSHDRHFLNKVCTHMADLDFGKIQIYVGNYDFWKESSELAAKLQADRNAKAEEKIKEADIILMQLEVPIDTVEYAATIANRYGKKVILNPAPASTLSNSFLNNVHTILPNRIEAEMLSGIKVMDIESAHRAAKAIGEKGIENVVITLGKDGAYVKEKDEYTMIPAKEVETIDTTGAGDVFCGAFSVYLSQGHSLAESVKFANAAAAIAVTRIGAQSAIPYKREVNL